VVQSHIFLGSPAAKFVRAPNEHTGEIHNFHSTKALAWITQCCSVHDEYSSQIQSRLPDRVLDLSSYASGFCTLLCTDSQMKASYAALSYCWGRCNSLTTTTDRLEAFKTEIPLQSMPKTHRDAVQVCWELGIHYLWIDALCIIQNCEDDKIKQLSRMRNYYQNALFVISASGAKNPDEGFLNASGSKGHSRLVDTRPDHTRSPAVFEVPFYCPDGLEASVILNKSPETYEAMEEPIEKRAWTFQEKHLSSRCLIFLKMGGFFLQCNLEDRHDDCIDFGQPLGRSRMFSKSARCSVPGANTDDPHTT
jgi:hypothetical protein